MTLLLALMLLHAVSDDPPTYERDLKPLLSKRCTICHNRRKVGLIDVSGGLALDTFEAVIKGQGDRPVVVPGQPEKSGLLARLNDPDEDRRMPLNEDPLPDSQRDLFRRWIEAGAPRGQAPATTTVATTTAATRRVVRSLDVVLPVAAKGPKGDAVAVALKVGPLPAVAALAFRGDGGLLAVGTAGRVVLWDLAGPRPAATLDDLPGTVHALAFSRDGRRLAVGSGLPARSGTVRVYSVPDGTLLADFAGHDDVVYALAFRPDGGGLASASFDQTVRLWDLVNHKSVSTFKGHSDFVYDVAYARDGRTVLSASKDRSIKRFDAATAQGLRTYSDHNEDVLALAIHPDGASFVTAGLESQLRWWRLDSEKPMRKVGGHSGPVHQLAFSGDGKRLISAGGDRSVRLWDGGSGTSQRTLPGPTDWQYAVALSYDGRLAAAGGWDGVARVWDANSGKLLVTLLQPPGEGAGGGDWLTIEPTGRLEASDNLRALVRWKAGGTETQDSPLKIGE